MKIFRSFCQGKLLLLQDKIKLCKYLKLVQLTPIPYLGVKKAVGYDSIFNHISYECANKVRDIKQLDFKEFSTFLHTINNFIHNCESEYPQNEQYFQEAIRIILEEGTFIQKFLTIQHIVIYFDSRITLYSQITSQLKDQIRDYQPKNTQEMILKLFWEQIDIYDQEKIDSLIEKKEEPQNPIMRLTKELKQQFISYIEVIQVECEDYNLVTQMVIYEIISRLSFDQDIEINDKQSQQIYYVSNQCQCKIEQQISDLNNFQLSLYMHLLNLNQHEINILSWDKVMNELSIRDLSSMTIEDTFKIWLLLYEIGRQNETVNDRIIDKLIKDIDKVTNKYYVLLCELLIETKNSKTVEYLKKWYPRIDLEKESAENLTIIMDTFNSTKLLNKLVLKKFLIAMGDKIKDLEEIYIENILISLVDHQVENEMTFQRAIQFELFENTSKYFLLNLLHYCQLYKQNHVKVKEIQEVLVQQLNKEYDEKVMIELLRILIQGTKKHQQKFITVITELRPFVKKFLDSKEGNLMGSESQFRALLQKVYNIK